MQQYFQLQLTQLNLLSSVHCLKKPFYNILDSLSFIQSLHDTNIGYPYISSLLYTYHQVVEKGKILNFCLIPSHIGIHGNNKADMFEVRSSKIQNSLYSLKCFIKFCTNSL